MNPKYVPQTRVGQGKRVSAPFEAIFQRLAEQTRLPLPVLSMGMSHDFEIAIEEGATEIHLGGALFGERKG
jgi:uncharacterized pyridoxal phosphate-containing UPF0001 family protein